MIGDAGAGARARVARDHALLLRAALGEGDEAEAAWRRWRAETDLDAIDGASARLLPLVARRFSDTTLGRSAGRVRGIHRFHWARNHQRLPALGALITGAQRQGAALLVVNGPALAARVYPDLGARVTDVVDVLVMPDSAGAVAGLARDLGWRPAEGPGGVSGPGPDGRGPAWLGGADGSWLVLHAGGEDGTARVRVGAIVLPALDVTETLLAVCGRSHQFREWASDAWIPDAVLLARGTASPIDWDRLVDRARKDGHADLVRERLAYLAAARLAPVPIGVLGALGRPLRPAPGRPRLAPAGPDRATGWIAAARRLVGHAARRVRRLGARAGLRSLVRGGARSAPAPRDREEAPGRSRSMAGPSATERS